MSWRFSLKCNFYVNLLRYSVIVWERPVYLWIEQMCYFVTFKLWPSNQKTGAIYFKFIEMKLVWQFVLGSILLTLRMSSRPWQRSVRVDLRFRLGSWLIPTLNASWWWISWWRLWSTHWWTHWTRVEGFWSAIACVELCKIKFVFVENCVILYGKMNYKLGATMNFIANVKKKP